MKQESGNPNIDFTACGSDAQHWNGTIAALPNAHILQTWEWGRLKSQYGWQPFHYTWQAGGRPLAAALVLQRAAGLAGRLRVLYVPRGPLLDWTNAALRYRVLSDLIALARRQRAIFIKMDPEVRLGVGVPGQPACQEDAVGHEIAAGLRSTGWRFSPDQIQFRNTMCIDLSLSEDALLAAMKQKTRYNIRLAQRKGVQVRCGAQDDLELLYRMYAETSLRDGFAIREEGYYRSAWSAFLQAGMATPLIAEVLGEPAAAVVIFHFAGRAWYLYGMSRDLHRECMPNYLLQWEAMRRARALGCQVYDLWGAPDHFNDSDSMWGVYRFKEGLGSQAVRNLGAWDYPIYPWLYRLYTQVLPRLLDVMRRRGKDQTRQAAGLGEPGATN